MLWYIVERTRYGFQIPDQELPHYKDLLQHQTNPRCSLPGRKVMTKLDSILKSRDITLPTKVHLVKAMVFPVVRYGRESWTIKKAER